MGYISRYIKFIKKYFLVLDNMIIIKALQCLVETGTSSHIYASSMVHLAESKRKHDLMKVNLLIINQLTYLQSHKLVYD